MDPLQLAQDLIRQDSVTSGSNRACSELLQRMLLDRGFEVICHSYRDVYGSDKVLISAIRSGSASHDTGLAFLSHNDVVSVDGWRATNGCGPFDAFVDSEKLWGRGACDMKGPIACVLAAIDQISPEQQTAPIYFFVTGDEECGMVGAQLLVQQCPIYRRMVQSLSVGVITEPTQLRVVNSHKGGCQFTVTAHGIAAHSSTSEGLNANWQLIPWLSYLSEVKLRIETDPALRNEAFDPPTLSMNVVLKNQPTAYNITVGLASCCVFIRTMPQTAWQALVDELTKRAREMELDVSAVAALSPVHTPAQQPIVQTALKVCSQTLPDAVSYATDGCRFSDLANMIVLGPGNIAQAHRCDEWIELEQLQRGTEVYRQLIQHYAG
ncbi:MAG: M20/M25/M40 family metallo-hydrolase [Pirellulales bacterium]